MQVRAGREAGRTDVPDHVPLLHPGTRPDAAGEALLFGRSEDGLVVCFR